MWWSLWLFCYLVIGTIFTGWMISISVKKGKMDVEVLEYYHLFGTALSILLWPLTVAMVIALGFGHAVKEKAEP